MALPTFDSALHHIGLGTSSGALKGLMLEGGFVKDVQKEVTQNGVELGGNLDLIGATPTLSRWTQDDFVGGMYAYNWGRDDAMFADCTGFMPAQQSRSLLSCPPMDEVASGITGTGRSMFMIGGYIYTLCSDKLYRTLIGAFSTTSFSLGTFDQLVFAEYDSNDQKIWLGAFDNSAPSVIRRINTDLSDPSVDAFYYLPPYTSGWSMMGGTIFNKHVVVQMGRQLMVFKPPDNPNPSFDTVAKLWRKVTRLPGRWKDSLAWNNTLYILVNDGSYKSQIYQFDGTDATMVCQFPFNFYAKCMIEYAGRIFVGGTGTDVNGGEQYAELYEVTGASTRLVRTFSPETRNSFLGGVAGEWPNAINDLVVHDGLLWMCQKGKRMIAYDVTSDGFFGAAEILGDSTREYSHFTTGRGRLWARTTDGEIDRIAQPADSVSTWNPTFITSDFTYEIAMLKTWSEIVVMTRYGKVTDLSYSVNSGETWTSLGAGTTVSSSQVHFCTQSLAAVTPSKIIRFRIKLSSTGDSGGTDGAKTYHRELVSWTVSYGMSNSTKKKAWNITINGADEIETRSATLDEGITQTYEPDDIRTQLWAWYDASTTLVLRDPNGYDYNVKIETMREVQPLIGPATTGGENEAQFPLTLLEV